MRFRPSVLFHLSSIGVCFLKAQQLDGRRGSQMEPWRGAGACLALNTQRGDSAVDPVGLMPTSK